MKKIILLFASLSIMLLAACGNNDNDTGASDSNTAETIQPLEVKFITESDAFKPGQEGTIKVKVTKGKENIADADEVLFEIWKGNDKENSTKFEAKNEGNGVYSLKHTFEEEGIYSVISHVTARGMHTMPTRKFKVGNIEGSAQSHGHNHGETNGLMVMLMKPDTIQANEEVELTAHLQNDNKPFTKSSVRFEYWKDGSNNHTFVDAEEMENGKYKANITFTSPGTYNVKTHVKKGDLHTHQVESIEVK